MIIQYFGLDNEKHELEKAIINRLKNDDQNTPTN